MKYLLKLFLVFFFAIQFKLTLFGGFFWPFSSHRLFSQTPPDQKTIVKAVVVDSDGLEQIVHPGRVIPIEYSRCSGLCRNIFGKGSEEQKKQLLDYLLKRLNEQPWTAFDEMFTSVRSDKPFVSLRFENHTIVFHPGRIEIVERSPLYP